MRFKSAKFYDLYAKPQIYVANALIQTLKDYRQNFDDIYEIGAGSGVLTRLIMENLSYENLLLNDLYESEFMSKFSTQIGDITQLKIKNKQDFNSFVPILASQVGHTSLSSLSYYYHITNDILNEVNDISNKELGYLIEGGDLYEE